MEKELTEALKTALSNEIAGEEFYKKTADDAKDEFTKNTFNHLANDEMFHIKRIREFIKTGKAVEIEEEIKNRNPKAGMKFFEMTEKEYNEKKEEYFQKNRSPYEYAIEIEIRAYNLYKELADKTEGKTKEFFEFLMSEEQTHRKILEEALVFMEDPDDYFLETEGWTFD